MTKCEHKRTTEEGPKPYSRPVAARIEDQNPGAHGGVRYTDICKDCGAWRDVLYNGKHVEYGPWEDEK